jgi:hypothetical protein
MEVETTLKERHQQKNTNALVSARSASISHFRFSSVSIVTKRDGKSYSILISRAIGYAPLLA